MFMLRILIALIVIAGTASELLAIPAFARKYSMSCKTCHAPFPKLKDYAEEFAANGFALKDKEATRFFQDTGDDNLSLIRDVPLAMRLEGYVTYNKEKSKTTDYYAPSVFKILSGGELSKFISYYAYYILEDGENGKIEDAYLMFNNIGNIDLDIYVGQFQVSDPLFKREVRLTRADYEILKVKVGASPVNLTYDRGLMINYMPVEGTDIFALFVNGTGIGTPGTNGNFDNDDYKNVAVRISQDIIPGVRIGTFGYFGKEVQRFSENAMNMFSGDFTLNAGPFELNAMYLNRLDDATLYSGSITDIRTEGAMAELIYLPNGDDSRFYGVAVFNWIQSQQETLNSRTLALHAGHAARRNIRLTAEWQYNFTHKFPTFSLGFIAAI